MKRSNRTLFRVEAYSAFSGWPSHRASQFPGDFDLVTDAEARVGNPGSAVSVAGANGAIGVTIGATRRKRRSSIFLATSTVPCAGRGYYRDKPNWLEKHGSIHVAVFPGLRFRVDVALCTGRR